MLVTAGLLVAHSNVVCTHCCTILPDENMTVFECDCDCLRVPQDAVARLLLSSASAGVYHLPSPDPVQNLLIKSVAGITPTAGQCDAFLLLCALRLCNLNQPQFNAEVDCFLVCGFSGSTALLAFVLSPLSTVGARLFGVWCAPLASVTTV